MRRMSLPVGPASANPATAGEVVSLIRDLPGLARRTQKARDTFRQEYADLDNGHASARLVDAVFVPRGDA